MTNSKPWVDGLTYGQVLRRTAERCGASDAVVFRHAGCRMTWSEFDAEVDSVAKGLLALGFKKGDHFGVWSTNWPEWLLLQFATARIGVVLVTINPAYRPTELEYAIAQSEIRGLALIEGYRKSHFFEILQEIYPELSQSIPGRTRGTKFPKLQWIIGMHADDHTGALNWSQLIQAGKTVDDNQLEEASSLTAANDPINLQYTSGTTGNPKGALLTHRNLLLNGYYTALNQRLDERDRICIPVPLYHCFGCVLGATTAAVCGAAMIFPQETFQADATLEAIEAERCTAIYGVPTMFIAQLEHPTFPQRDTSSLRTGIMAGSPCPIELMKRVVKDMGASEITIGYGQTEAAPLITSTTTDDTIEHRVGTVGRPIEGIEVKVIDPQTGATLPDNQSGELCCRGHNVMLGYFNLPEQTAKAIDSEGWLHTGDMALRQPDGFYRITGRFKDLIIRGGENIAPREIEELLYQHPQVEDAQVIGVPDRKFGEEVAAWIKLRAGACVSEDDIRNFCRERLAHFKTPRYVRFVDSFPTTVTGKIQKYKIREQAIIELGLQEIAAIETA